MKRKLLYLFVAITLIVSLFGVALPAAAATITLDGQTGDWAGIPPVVEEPGDITTGPDIAAAYLTHDATNLYLRMDIAQMVGGTALHVGIDADRNIATGYNTDTDLSDVFLQPHNIGIDYEIRIVLIQGQPATATLYSIAGPTTWNPVLSQSLNKGVTAPGVQPLVAEVALPLNLLAGTVVPWKFVFWVNPAAGGAPSDEAPDNTFSIYPPRIVFVSDRDGNLEIYKMHADSSNQTRLTNNSAYDNMPFPSSNGSQIAFVSNRDGNREIYVMSANDTNVTQLTVTTNISNEWPFWSPDGTRIAFSSDRNGGYDEIYTMNASDGSGLIQLTNNSTGDTYPVWSPDGSKIAFTSIRDGGYGEIYVMNANGDNQTRLTNNPARDNFPFWSPDGTKLTFASNRDGNWEIYNMNANGDNQIRLTSTPGYDNFEPVGLQGTSRIVFTSNRDGNAEIYVMDSNGANQTRLTNNPPYGDWSRGKWVKPSVITNHSSDDAHT